MIRIALVGVSGYGRWHLKMIEEQTRRRRARLVAATITNQPEVVEVCARLSAGGVALFDDYETMLKAMRASIDLVMLPTGIHLHAPMAIAALEAGLHVLVEKPLAATLREVDEIEAARLAAGRIVAVGFQELYTATTHEVKRRLLAGEIGAVRQVNVIGQWPRPLSYYTRNEWAGRARVGDAWVLDSPVSNAFAHFVMLALFWAGPRPETAAEIESLEAELYRAQPIKTFDTVSLVLMTTTGVRITFNASHSGEINLPPEVHVAGDRGEVRWVLGRECIRRSDTLPDETWALPDITETRLQVLDEVVSRLRGEEAFIVDPALARVHTQLIEALRDGGEPRLIPASACVRKARGEDTFIAIPGLDAAIRLAVDSGRLLSQAGLPW